MTQMPAEAALSAQNQPIQTTTDISDELVIDQYASGYDETHHVLTSRQYQAIDLLISGKTDREAAEVVGVVRQTVTQWRLHTPRFQAELERRRDEMWSVSVNRVRSLLDLALNQIESNLHRGQNPLATAFRVVEVSGLARGCRDDAALRVLPGPSHQALPDNEVDYAQFEIPNDIWGP